MQSYLFDLCGRPMDHDEALGVTEQQVVQKNEVDQNCLRRSHEGESGEPLHKGGDEIGGEQGRAEEDIGHAEKARPVLDRHDRLVKEAVELVVKLGVVSGKKILVALQMRERAYRLCFVMSM